MERLYIKGRRAHEPFVHRTIVQLQGPSPQLTCDRLEFETAAATIHGVLPRAVAEYAHFGRSIATALMEHDTEASEPTRTAKVGRNAPCPCGSGQKYKRCCGSTVH